MKPHIILSTLFILIFSLCEKTISAQGFLRAEGKQIVDDSGNNVILRGKGLGGSNFELF